MTQPTPQDIERAEEIFTHNICSAIDPQPPKSWYRETEEEIINAIAQALASERERVILLFCPHANDRGTGHGIYDMQYKDCCVAAEAIRKGGV